MFHRFAFREGAKVGHDAILIVKGMWRSVRAVTSLRKKSAPNWCPKLHLLEQWNHQDLGFDRQTQILRPCVSIYVHTDLSADLDSRTEEYCPASLLNRFALCPAPSPDSLRFKTSANGTSGQPRETASYPLRGPNEVMPTRHSSFESRSEFCPNSELPKNVFHQAPFREARLQQVRADERGEPIPVVIHPHPQRQRYQHKCSRNNADVTIHCHFPPRSLM